MKFQEVFGDWPPGRAGCRGLVRGLGSPHRGREERAAHPEGWESQGMGTGAGQGAGRCGRAESGDEGAGKRS